MRGLEVGLGRPDGTRSAAALGAALGAAFGLVAGCGVGLVVACGDQVACAVRAARRPPAAPATV